MIIYVLLQAEKLQGATNPRAAIQPRGDFIAVLIIVIYSSPAHPLSKGGHYRADRSSPLKIAQRGAGSPN